MTMDVDAVDLLEALLVARRLRADDRHQVARRRQRARLLPDAPVERARQVLDDDAATRPYLRTSLVSSGVSLLQRDAL